MKQFIKQIVIPVPIILGIMFGLLWLATKAFPM